MPKFSAFQWGTESDDKPVDLAGVTRLPWVTIQCVCSYHLMISHVFARYAEMGVERLEAIST